jgi:hypothetical protein
MPGCYTLRELWLSPWGIMAWGATPRSSRLQPGEMSQAIPTYSERKLAKRLALEGGHRRSR